MEPCPCLYVISQISELWLSSRRKWTGLCPKPVVGGRWHAMGFGWKITTPAGSTGDLWLFRWLLAESPFAPVTPAVRRTFPSCLFCTRQWALFRSATVSAASHLSSCEDVTFASHWRSPLPVSWFSLGRNLQSQKLAQCLGLCLY